ncbi:MAG: hypothetical protein Q8M16_07790 [Pirellulaceae bacterium]|nr:hypothetical protein [Pirellulaceae bacterium]
MSCQPQPAHRFIHLTKILSSQSRCFRGWLLCLFRTTSSFATLSLAMMVQNVLVQADIHAQAVPDSGPAAPSFDLPAIGTNRWYRDTDFRGRPVVVIHIASWSPATRRMLPLWQQQLQPAVAAGRIHVVGIAHEQHAGRARLLCDELGWPWLVLHDPLAETLQAPNRIDFPSATVLDARGMVTYERLTLAELSVKVLAPKSDLHPLWAADPDAAAEAAPLERPSRGQLLSEFQSQRQEDATLESLQPLANHLLRQAFDSSIEQAREILPPIISFYQEALHHTEDGRWAFRLAVAFRLAFDLSNAAQQTDAALWQRSLDYLELANQSAAASPIWREWLGHYRPGVDQTQAAYGWLANRLLEPLPNTAERPMDQKSLGLPLFAIESALPDAPETSPSENAISWPRSTPVPPASIQIQPVWVNSRSSDNHGRWARLYLHVHLKRGDWSLDTEPRLEWNPANLDEISRPIEKLPHVHSSRWTHPDELNSGATSFTSSVWLEMDWWIPASAPTTTSIDSGVPPRRNARLIFQGRDPLTGQIGWRKAEFYLPTPQRSPVDW